MYRILCRVYQKVMKLGLDIVPFWRRPELITGADAQEKLSLLLEQKGIKRILMVTDVGLGALGLHKPLLERLTADGIVCAVYDKTVANPTIDNVEEALALYHRERCEALIAFGGGSPMDCAKTVGARVAKPKQSVTQMRGILKIHKRIPLLIAIPTTAGTGSETTLAAVIKDANTLEKYPINDFVLIPRYAVLDPILTTGLPKHITAQTGMDALTHAVEAYIGKSNTKQTRQDCIDAVKLVFANLERAYENGGDMDARGNMQRAAFLAGAAFTRAYVGYVHAIAHSLGGEYGTPHGLANAVILPYVLDAYGDAVYKPLSELADLVGLAQGKSDKERAEAFIAEVRAMNARMGIPEKLSGIRQEDIDRMVRHAIKEANPLYPVPRIMRLEELTQLYYQVMEG